jgi:hypothetical protein
MEMIRRGCPRRIRKEGREDGREGRRQGLFIVIAVLPTSMLTFPPPSPCSFLRSLRCFNHLLLPPYSTKEKLEEKLKAAMLNAEGFGLR